MRKELNRTHQLDEEPCCQPAFQINMSAMTAERSASTHGRAVAMTSVRIAALTTAEVLGRGRYVRLRLSWQVIGSHNVRATPRRELRGGDSKLEHPMIDLVCFIGFVAFAVGAIYVIGTFNDPFRGP
jgi:hypothetical protein